MSDSASWNSQPLDEWAERYAQGQFVDLGGNRTHYIDRGEGDPVLLVHGFNMDSATWTNNIEPLAEHFRILALDLWGEGFSTRDPLDYGYPLYTRQIQLFMDALDIERAALIGHSMGGGTSASFALQHPERVDRLVLVDSVGIPAELPLRARIFQLPGVPEILLRLPIDFVRRKNLLDYWIHDGAQLTSQYFEEFTRFQKIEGSTEALLSILRRDFFNTLDSEFQALGNNPVPKLIIWGREDTAVPLDSGHEIHRLLEGSRLEIIEDAGHMPFFEHPEFFNQLVIDFLNS